MNEVILIGRLAQDPDLRTTANGTSVARFTVAVPSTYSSQKEEKKTDFISCVAWQKLAENIGKYGFKGMMVAVKGRVQNRSYDDQKGNKKYVTEILANSIMFLSKKKEETEVQTQPQVQEKEEVDPFMSFSEEVEMIDNDWPF